jgi:RNA polymerase sigma-70 factor (ECF subfamily)
LLAGLEAQEKFAGKSSVKTWLTGILKHKIVDSIRRSSRESTVVADPLAEASEFDALFDATGHWAEAPAAWPDNSLEQKQFFAVLEDCLARLPAKTAQAFMMREHMGSDTDEICQELAVTPTHCWVLLYRARMALRECLQANWFGK